jgi:hypothetical protein
MSIHQSLRDWKTYKSGLNIRKVVDLKDLGSRVGTVLSEATIFKMLVP